MDEDPRLTRVFELLEEIDEDLAKIHRSTSSPREWGLRALLNVQRAALRAWKRDLIQDWP